MHNTRMRVRVSHFTRYYHVTYEQFIFVRHGVFNEQFIFILCFYWLILSHLDWHVNND
jgi:hypothetical protein